MKIVNITAVPQFLIYASTTSGGRTLQPGESSSELSLQRVHIDTFQRNLNDGKIQIRLNEKEREFINMLLAEDKKPIVVKKLPPPPPKPPKKQPKKEKPLMKSPMMESPLSMAPMTAPVKPTGPTIPVTKEALDKGEISLADLMKANNRPMPKTTSGPDEKASMSEISAFMGSKV